MKKAVIIARGGSKRIPKKNIRDFCGKPIIAYSIEAAHQSGCFDEVMVSTDDDEIAEIAHQYGANVPFMRSAETSSDFASTVDVLLEVIHAYHKKEIYPDLLCCLYPTAPFVTANHLLQAHNLLSQHPTANTIFPIVSFSYPIQRALRMKDNKVCFIHEEHKFTRSQDLEQTYHDAGQFYWCRVNALLNNKSIIADEALGIVLPEWQVQDIDNLDDWILAEIKYTFLKQNKLQ